MAHRYIKKERRNVVIEGYEKKQRSLRDCLDCVIKSSHSMREWAIFGTHSDINSQQCVQILEMNLVAIRKSVRKIRRIVGKRTAQERGLGDGVPQTS
jgi:hypothetical protein